MYFKKIENLSNKLCVFCLILTVQYVHTLASCSHI